MNVLFFSALIIFIGYLGRIISYSRNWRGLPEFDPTYAPEDVGITIIVPFRNEESCLQELLNVLDQQVYTAGKIEILLVDDHSEDLSVSQAQQFCEDHPSFKYLLNSGSGKKAAIRTGVKHAAHEFILTTDADCIIQPLWAKAFSAFFKESGADLVLGLVDITTDGKFCSRFQEAEFLSLIAAGSGAAAAGYPLYGNAASFGFRKSVFLEMEDAMNENVVSGDDTFFIHNAKKGGRKISILKSKQAIVLTKHQESWSLYFNQRIRWVSKSRHYRDLNTIITAVWVMLMNAVLLFSLAFFLRKGNPGFFVVFFALKTFTDYHFLAHFLGFYGKHMPVLRFVIFSFMYPFMVVIWTIWGLTGSYEWKGRKFQGV